MSDTSVRTTNPEAVQNPVPRMRRIRSRAVLVAPGLSAIVPIAVGAEILGRLIPIVGAPVFGIVLGVVTRACLGERAALKPGVDFASKQILQAAIVVFGLTLSLRQVAHVGYQSLPVLAGTFVVAFLGTILFGRVLRVRAPIRTLIGVGTAICGASAIAAVGAVMDVEAVEFAYAISTIFIFNIIAIGLFPLIGHLLGMSQHAFGLWAGTAINDTSSVTAASFPFGHAAGEYGVIVKLTRTLFIVPIVLFIASRGQRRGGPGAGPESGLGLRRMSALVPTFIYLFVIAVIIGSFAHLPSESKPDLTSAAIFLIAVALTGVGLSTSLGRFRQAGVRPLALGGILWLLVAACSLLVQWFTGAL